MKNAVRNTVITHSIMTSRRKHNVEELPVVQVRTKNCFVREFISNITKRHGLMYSEAGQLD